MGKVIAISNHKGGVGKTTSALNIGVGLSLLKKKVLLIDLDPQSNLTESLGIEDVEESIYEALIGEIPLKGTKVSDTLYIVPSTIDLTGAEIELSSEIGREAILRKLINKVKGDYDYIFIDCPPSLGLLTINALTAADEIYIPLQAEYLAFKGLSRLISVVEKVRDALNENLEISGVIITRFSSRKILNQNIADVTGEYFEDKLFKTRIRENIALAEAPSQGNHIFDYDAKSNGAIDYMALCKEILERES